MGEFQDRLNKPTPNFFKKIRKWIIWASGSFVTAGGTLITIQASIESTIGKPINIPILTVLGTIFLVSGTIAGVLGTLLTSLPIESKNTEENK